ncbi:hypothetical protein L3Y34_019187 [Caenorhabditis briggsae]|uniref:BTB domain-containing protein n=1 Tax=Caenorhabditis briggsae TaxID=6238 RepID=A0AAE9DN14_CAEBR|nr:hypothetical protein L3Y34_019187 [Caenorhabditis briggsae]
MTDTDTEQFRSELLEKIQSLEAKQNENVDKILEKLESLEKTTDVNNNSIELKKSENNSGKGFMLTHVFKNIPEIEENKDYNSDTEEYFNVPWKFSITKQDKRIGFLLFCEKSKSTENWLIDTEYELKFRIPSGRSVEIRKFERRFENSVDGGWGSKECMEWDQLEKEFIHDGSLIVEVSVKIKKMDGTYQKTSKRSFSEPKFSDAVLISGDQKFYVPKLFLASQSTYFDALFHGQFQESKMAEITLTDIDSDDFQNFLELLHGEPAIDEDTVEGILLLADMYDSKTAIERCEDFLLNFSKKTMKKKLEMSQRYNLNKLKKHCLDSLKTVKDIESVLFSDILQMDPAIVAALFSKCIFFYNKEKEEQQKQQVA